MHESWCKIRPSFPRCQHWLPSGTRDLAAGTGFPLSLRAGLGFPPLAAGRHPGLGLASPGPPQAPGTLASFPWVAHRHLGPELASPRPGFIRTSRMTGFISILPFYYYKIVSVLL